MSAKPPDLEEIILAIHANSLSPDGWDRTVAELCRFFDARGASLVRPALSRQVPPSVNFFELDPAHGKRYVEHWGRHDVWFKGATRTGRIGLGVINTGEDLIEHRDYRRSDFYNDYLKPMDIDRMMNLCLAEPSLDYGPTALSFYRRVGKPEFTPDDRRRLAQLYPHLQVAIQNFWDMQSMRLMNHARADALDLVTSAVFGLDEVGRLILTNQAADALLRGGRWLQMIDRMLVPSPALAQRAALAGALRQLSQGVAFRLKLLEGAGGTEMIVSGAPVNSDLQARHAPGARALLWLTPMAGDADAARDIARLCGLTKAEEKFVAHLIGGLTLAAAAAQLGISRNTARSHLKAIFQKSGQRTQSALLAFATRLSMLRAGRTDPR